MDNFRWLGLFSSEVLGIQGATPADALIFLLKSKLELPSGGRDMIILLHEILARYPAENGSGERVTSTLVEYGVPGGTTAMAKAVGLPAAIAVELLLAGQLPLTGCHVPTHPAVYQPILSRLEDEGLRFRQTVEPVA